MMTLTPVTARRRNRQTRAKPVQAAGPPRAAGHRRAGLQHVCNRFLINTTALPALSSPAGHEMSAAGIAEIFTKPISQFLRPF